MNDKARKLFDIWIHECLCGSGHCVIGDCPGPPTEKQKASVLAWMENGGEAPDIWPFRDEEYWDNFIKREAIL